MPPVPVPNGDFLLATLASLHQRLSALEVQQQSIISNLQGQPVVALGLQPGSDPAEYGIGLLNKAMGSTIALFGEDANGNVACTFYDSSGVKQTSQDQTGFHVYDGSGNEGVRLDGTGLHVYNSSGTEELRAGELSTSPAIYGLGVLPSGGGSLQQVDGFLSATVTSLLTITGGGLTWQNIGGPSVSATVGPSGKALVTISAACQYGTTSQLQAGVGIDGSTSPQTAPLIDETTGTTGQVLTMSSTAVISGLSAGNHTFKMIYYGQSNAFSNSTIAVAPL